MSDLLTRIDRSGNDRFDVDDDLSLGHLNDLIACMSTWSMKQHYTKAQTAAWRLRWFGKTPEQDTKDREDFRLALVKEIADLTKGQGVYD